MVNPFRVVLMLVIIGSSTFLLVLSIFVSGYRTENTRAQQMVCSLHSQGDADCDGFVDTTDFEIFRKEFIGLLSTRSADFDGDGMVTVADFEQWRRGYFGAASLTSTPTPTMVSPTNTPMVSVTPSPSLTRTPTNTPPPAPTATATKAPTPAPPTIGISPSATPTKTLLGCTYPAQVLNLTNWKITLPIRNGSSSSPLEILQPQLATYFVSPWFMVNPACNGVQFRAHTSAPVTTSNSSYPRSELREMTNGGKSLASWSNTSGTHTMTIVEAIIAVPKGKQHVVAGQIHDGSSDVIVIRLEQPKLFIDINGNNGPVLDPAYTLGKRFTVTFVASGGKIHIYYNGGANPAYTLTKNISNSFFKAGAYTQSNCAREAERGETCSEDNYGEVQIYELSVTHQ